ncbi:MAG: hypothetical protein ACXVSX_15730 [Solirubrobacteraceae bacterium]
MSLALQIAGCALAAFIVLAALGVRPTRAAAARAIGGVVAAVLGILALNGVWSSAVAQRQARSDLAKKTRTVRDQQAPSVIGINVPFVEWVAQRIPTNQTFALARPDDTATQWMSYRLMPRWLAPDRRRADWIVFYGVSPRQVGYRRSQFAEIHEFQPNFSIARVR